MKALSWLRKIRESERGNMLVIGAAAMPVMIGSAALALDTIQMGLWKRQLQRAADSAALAGAHAVAQGKPHLAAVTRDLDLNDQIELTEDPVANNAPATGRFVSNNTAVEVILQAEHELPFLSFFTSSPTLTARSVAAKVRGDNHCLLALDRDEQHAINITGNANLDLGCGIASNSDHAEAARLWGSATVSATGLTAVGGLAIHRNITFPQSARHPNADPQIDPFGPDGRDLRMPTSPSECRATNLQISGGTHVLRPGRYCGGIAISGGSVTFEAGGQYILDRGVFSINGGTVTGNGVTLFLTGSGNDWADLSFNGNSNITLKAPLKTSGSPYYGVVVMADPRMPEDTLHTINGNASVVMRGAMYMPSTKVRWNGGADAATTCLQIIARTIHISGNPGNVNTCTDNDGANGFATLRVRLVE